MFVTVTYSWNCERIKLSSKYESVRKKDSPEEYKFLFCLSGLSLLNCQNLILIDWLNPILALTNREVKRIKNMLLTSILSKWSLAIFFYMCFLWQECWDKQTCSRFVLCASVVGFAKPKFLLPLKGGSHPHVALSLSGHVFPSHLHC